MYQVEPGLKFSTRGMGYMDNGVQAYGAHGKWGCRGQWGTGGMEYMGNGPDG